MKRLSIKQRVAIWYTLFMVLIVMLAFTTVYLNGRRLVNEYYESTMVSTAALAVDDIRQNSGMLEIDRNLDSLPNVRVSLFDENGQLLYGRMNFDLGFKEKHVRSATDYSGQKWYAYDSLLHFEDSSAVWLRCSMPATTAGILQSIGLEMLIILPAFVILAAIGGYLITRRAFRPVEEIARTAESIADGKDLKKRITPGPVRDELYDLSRVFNEMFDRLERAFEAERRFTSDASHELRTPVTAILAQADFALSEHASESDRLAALEDIRLRASRMSELIRRLLSLTRMDAGRTRLEYELLDLTELTEIVVMQLEADAEKRGISLICGSQKPVMARFDQTMILQALLNLVGNAIKYIAPNGHVWINTFETANEVSIAVKDDGPGIPEKDMPLLFERFYQGDRSHHIDGAGLGLPLVKMIAELHSGRIEAANNADSGCVFTLVLPKKEEKP